MSNTTPETTALQEDDAERDRDARQTADADEARIVAAWKSGKYRSKERCLEALDLEKLHNAALWKRVKRAIDRDDRRATLQAWLMVIAIGAAVGCGKSMNLRVRWAGSSSDFRIPSRHVQIIWRPLAVSWRTGLKADNTPLERTIES